MYESDEDGYETDTEMKRKAEAAIVRNRAKGLLGASKGRVCESDEDGYETDTKRTSEKPKDPQGLDAKRVSDVNTNKTFCETSSRSYDPRSLVSKKSSRNQLQCPGQVGIGIIR